MMESRIVRCVQGSSDWFDARCGKVTGSRVADAIAVLKRKEGEAACRYKLKRQIAREILTGLHADSYVSKAMENGLAREPLARTEYELKTGNDVRLVGFVGHPSIERAGFSPDGITGKDGIIEIKCPLPETHIDYLIGKKVPEDYEPQCMWGLAVTEREWCDFISYDPDQVKRHQLLIVRMHRDEKIIAEMNAAVLKFLEEVDDLVHKLEAGENYYIEQLEASIHQVGRGAQQV
jgi:putative phage-type endonuclease